jgi:hypothetical protein
MATKQIYIPKELASGYGFTAPLGTTPLPDDPTQELNSPFASFGRIGTDGITRGFDSESEDIQDMFGNTVATATTTDSETFQFKMIDVNETSLGAFYGSNAVTALDGGGYRIVSNGSWAVARTYAFRVILEATDTATTYGLIVIPNGKISTRGEQTIKGAALVEHDVTVTALPDDNGNRAYLYISAPQPVTPPTPTETYTVQFDPNGGEGTTQYVEVPSGTSIDLPDAAEYGWEKTGYTFGGFAESAESTTPVADPYTPAGNVVLYAIWE